MNPNHDVEASATEPTVTVTIPHWKLLEEGMMVQLAGCWFMISAVRRTRVTLLPMPTPPGHAVQVKP